MVKVTARIMGEDYTIRGRAPREHIERVAKYVDERMLEIAEAYPKLGTSRVAVLAAINMADELFKLKEQYEQLTQLLEEEWSQRHGPGTAREAAAAGERRGEGGAAAGERRDESGVPAGEDVGVSSGRLFTGDALTRPPAGSGAAAGAAGEPPEDEDQ